MQILVVDQDRQVGQALHALLQRHGHEVRYVPPTDPKLTQVLDKPMDLLICDVMINHSCGLDFITSVKSRRPHLPIVVLTGANPAHWRQACEQAGSASYLRKPAAPQSIVRQVALIAKARLDVRVALIDKDAQHRVELTRLLDAMGCCIESYASAAQALPIASDDKAPAVWVADATDPDLLTLLGRIRVAETPVFAFRQSIDVQREEDLMRAGAAMFLSKPIDVETLLTQANLLTRQPNPQNT